jgi:hypothetical protein
VAENSISELLALVQIAHGAEAANSLRKCVGEDPEWVREVATASLSKEFIGEKFRINAEERKRK